MWADTEAGPARVVGGGLPLPGVGPAVVDPEELSPLSSESGVHAVRSCASGTHSLNFLIWPRSPIGAVPQALFALLAGLIRARMLSARPRFLVPLG